MILDYQYMVVISSREVIYCRTEADVWDTLGKRFLSDTYMVHNKDGSIAAQFVPF